MVNEDRRERALNVNPLPIFLTNAGFMIAASLLEYLSPVLDITVNPILTPIFSAAIVALNLLPDKSGGCKLVLSAIAFAMITETIIIAVYIYLTGARAISAQRWPFGETLIFAAGMYFVALMCFYTIRKFLGDKLEDR